MSYLGPLDVPAKDKKRCREYIDTQLWNVKDPSAQFPSISVQCVKESRVSVAFAPWSSDTREELTLCKTTFKFDFRKRTIIAWQQLCWHVGPWEV